MPSLKELSKKSELFTAGHRMCAGCGAPIIMRQMLLVQETPVVVSCATGCLEVSTTLYPFTSWRCSFIHNAFENSAATISGVEAAYRSLKRQGKITQEIRFIGIGGDGGTYDIGLQSISGAMERGHRMLYICYDNGAYMNTGVQRSSSTPRGADTTTQPAGKAIQGKQQYPKDLTGIMAAHKIPYVAQASPSHWNDFMTKVQKAMAIDGPTFINVISPCPPGWRYDTKYTMELAKIAVETCFWPLYEVENGTKWKVTYKPRTIRPITDWINLQGRFSHLLKPENRPLLDEIQEYINKNWNELLKKEAAL